MRDLYTFAGIPVTSEMLISVNQHFNAELVNKTDVVITDVSFTQVLFERLLHYSFCDDIRWPWCPIKTEYILYTDTTVNQSENLQKCFRDYYSVFKKSSYIANNTQLKNLTSAVRLELQTECSKVLESLKYDLNI